MSESTIYIHAPSNEPLSREQKRSVWGWAFYDWAESAFSTSILVAVLPIYYLSIAPSGPITFHLGPWQITTAATSLWAYTVGLSTLIIAVPSPVLGAIADSSGRRKWFLGFFAYTGALFSALLICVGHGQYLLASVIFLVANAASVGGTIFYNSLLLDIAPPGRIDSVSGKGFALGYAGGGILLVVNLLMVSQPKWFGIPSAEWGARLSFLTVGLWWAVFTIPTLLLVRERRIAAERPSGGYIRLGIRRTVSTLRHALRYRDLVVFIVAFLIYNDGIQTVIVMAVPYGKEVLGLGAGTLMGVIVLIQVIGVPGSLLFGAVAERWGAKRAVISALVIWSVVVVYAWRMQHPAEFWVLGVLVGFVLGGSQAISRSLYGAMIPVGHNAEFYGFLAVSSRFASFLGPIAFGLARDLTGSMRAAIIALVAFFLVGLVVLTAVNVERGMREAGRTPASNSE